MPPPQDRLELRYRQMLNPLTYWFAFLFLGSTMRIATVTFTDVFHTLDVERDRIQARHESEDTFDFIIGKASITN
jgi:hypothetical protein